MNQLFKTPKDYVRGIPMLHDPKKTQDTAFTAEQRRENGLEGRFLTPSSRWSVRPSGCCSTLRRSQTILSNTAI